MTLRSQLSPSSSLQPRAKSAAYLGVTLLRWLYDVLFSASASRLPGISYARCRAAAFRPSQANRTKNLTYFRICDRSFEQHLKICRHACDRAGFEQIEVVNPGTDDLIG